MITIPCALLAVFVVLSFLAGGLVCQWADVSGAKHLRKVVDLTTRQEAIQIARRDEALAAVDTACKRLHECEDVIEKIRKLLPPECDVTYSTH